MTSGTGGATSTANTSTHGAQRTDGAQRTANFFFRCFRVPTGRTAAHTPTVPMEAPPQRSFLSGVSAIFAHKRTVAQPTFADFTDLAATFSKLFEKQITYRNKHRGNHQAIDPALAKEFCKTIVNIPEHRKTVRYIVDSVAHGQSLTDVMDQFEAQNKLAKEQHLPLPFPKEVLPFVRVALESVFLQLPTAEHLKNTQAGIQESTDDAVYKFAASLQANISHQAMSLGMKLASACFPLLGVKTTLYIGSWFVPSMIKNITDAVAPKKAAGMTNSKSAPESSNMHDAAQYVLEAFARLEPIKSALTEACKPEAVNTIQLSGDDEKRLVNKLWDFAAALMSATDGTVDITEGPYKGWQLLEDNTVITSVGGILKESDPVSKDVLSQSAALREKKIESRRKEMLKVFKENIPFFREVFKSQNPKALIKALLNASVLPKELQELVTENTKLLFASTDLTALMKSLLQAGNEEVLPTDEQQKAAKETEEKGNARQAVLPPEMQKQKLVEAGMGKLIDLIPGDELDGIAKLFTDTLNNFKPNEINYFTAFKEELVSSLKSSERVKSLSQVADVLTTQYFSAIPIHKKRVMACAILSGGKPEFKPDDEEHRDLTDDSKTKFILAMTNKGGIGFQKAMQLFGDSVNDPVMSKALNSMKDSVEPLGAQWARNKYTAELAKINKNLRDAAVDGKYVQYTVVDGSFDPTPLKAATVGQVHKAIVDVTYHIRSKDSVDVTGDKVEESKTIKNKPVVIKLLRENAKREVSVEMNALTSLPEVKKDPSVNGTLQGVKEGILEEVDFTIEKENGDLLHNIYRGEAYTSNNTKVTMKTAEVYAATSDMLIEELVQGSNFQELWYGKQKKDEEPKPVTYKENPASDDQGDIEIYSRRSSVEERLEFLDQWRLSVGLLARNWVSGMVNGTSDDGSANLGGMGVIDSDRHSGNVMYDPYKKTLNIIDYGTITKLDRQQRAAMVNLTAAIFARNANGVVDNLAELMRPADKSVGDSPTASEFLSKRNLKFDDYQKSLKLKGEGNEAPAQVKVDKNRTLTTDIRDAILKRSEKEKHEDLLRALQNIGFLKSDTTLTKLYEMIPIEDPTRPDSTGQGQKEDGLRSILKKSNKEVAAQQIITVLNGGPQARPLTKIEDGRQKDLEKYLKTDSDDRLFNVARPNGSDQSRLLPASLSDANDELYFIRTIQKIANVLTDYGVSAPKSIVQLNRGTSFMRNHLHKNGYMKAVDEFLVAHKAELLKEPENRSAENATELTSKAQAKLDAMAAKLKNISLGDSFLSALLPQGMNTAMAVASQLTQPTINWVDSKTGISKGAKSSYQIAADICALAAKTMRGVDKRLLAAGAVATVGAGVVAYYNGDVTSLTNAAGNVLAGAADQSTSMLMDIASSMRNMPTYV